ncbi:hypothetical protein BST20_09415 [Mycobacterium branderi]|nr:PPE family protein [Mycobacterium branderi]ORA39775.1 hypothetical protein BST20_09415 [Mycobacterium branderi]
MAFPPEVHSTLLSTGPGPGPMLAAAGTWSALSAEYEAAATELTSVLAGGQAVWEGPTAEQYAAAHMPYLAWLSLASTLSAEAAAAHTTVAGAYTAALAAMPTLPELAANHAIHAVLVATNFFGINTIPIALNEADYARMWTQAATTMSTYQATAKAAQNSSGAGAGSGAGSGSGAGGGGGGGGGTGSFQLPTPDEIWQMLFGPDGEQIPGQGQPNWSPEQYLQNLGNFFNGNAQALAWLQQNMQGLLNPSQAPALIAYFIAWQTYRIVNWTLRTLRFLIQELPLLITVGVSLMMPTLAGGLAGLAGLAGLSGLAGLAQPAAVPAPAPQPAVLGIQPPVVAPVTVTPTIPTSPLAPAAPTVAAPATAAAAAAPPAAPPVPPVPVTGAEGFGYMVGFAGLSSDASLSTRSKAKKPTAQSTEVAARAAAPEAQERTRRRLHSVIDRGYRHEYLDAGPDQGAGTLGFAGTVTKKGLQAAGLSTLAAAEYGGGPTMPMLPESWGEGPGQ